MSINWTVAGLLLSAVLLSVVGDSYMESYTKDREPRDLLRAILGIVIGSLAALYFFAILMGDIL